MEGRLASFGKVVNRRLDILNGMVQSEHSEIQSLLHDIMRLSSAQTRAGTVLALALNRVEQFAILNSHLSHFQHGLELLASGILSPALVSPADLHRALTSVKQRVLGLSAHNGLRLHVIRDKVIDMYKMHDFVTVRQGQNIIIQLPIYLGFLEKPLTLFKVITIPLMTPGTDRHVTQLNSVPRFFAFDTDSAYYLEFNRKPDVLRSKLLFLEDAQETLKSINHSSCILAIIRHDKSQIDQWCSYTVITDAVRPSVMLIDRHHVLLTNISDVTVRCTDGAQKDITCAATCKIKLPCGCSLESGSVFVPAKSADCNLGFGNIQALHTVNLPFLSEFFDASQLAEFSSSSLLSDPLKVTVPELKIYEADFSHQLQRDKQAPFDLKQLTRSASLCFIGSRNVTNIAESWEF